MLRFGLCLFVLYLISNFSVETIWRKCGCRVKTYNLCEYRGRDRKLYRFNYTVNGREFSGLLDTKEESVIALRHCPSRIRKGHTVDYMGYVLVKTIFYWLIWLFIVVALLKLGISIVFSLGYVFFSLILVFIGFTGLPCRINGWLLKKEENPPL